MVWEHFQVMNVVTKTVFCLGFLCLENDSAPGNIGLYDMILALQFIKNHIRHFGGDTNRIIIAGWVRIGSINFEYFIIKYI